MHDDSALTDDLCPDCGARLSIEACERRECQACGFWLDDPRFAANHRAMRAFTIWLEAEIEASRQLLRQDPIATRTALERVRARLPR